MADPVPRAEPDEGLSGELSPFGEVVVALATIGDDEDGNETTMELEEVRLALSIEFEVRDADAARPRITGSTPTQWTETTIMPTFHRLAMCITRESDG